MKAVRIDARMILDSRGSPTIEAEVEVADGEVFRGSAPSGASTGSHESVELRDGDQDRWDGRGVERAIQGLRDEVAPALMDMDLLDLPSVDAMLVSLDGTSDRSRLGANTLLAASIACARAGAGWRRAPLWEYLAEYSGCTPTLPLPMVNILSGHLHAGGGMGIQDVLVVPHGAPDYPTAMEWVVAVYRRAGELLRLRGLPALVGDEGGYGLIGGSSEEGIALVVEAIDAAGYEAGTEVSIALDVAGTHLLDGDGYRLDGELYTREAFLDRLMVWCDRYPICSIEDPLGEDAWGEWTEFVSRVLDRDLQVLGDDLIVTHRDRLDLAIGARAANAVLVKANQVGTLTEALDVASHAAASGFRAVVSARSGETEDDWLADLAIASGVGQIKVGSVVRSERLAKYNRLLRVAGEASGPRYAGGSAGLPFPVVRCDLPGGSRGRDT